MPPTRRQFLGSLASFSGFASASTLFPSVARAQSVRSANGKVQHACIGVGGMMGGHDLQNFLSHPDTEVVAICDVDANHLEAAKVLAPKARVYRDWRELLKNEADRVDSVNITVPDHMHAVIAATALRQGKHVYCQKPMCHDVSEVRLLTQLAAEKAVKTQLGNQHASGIGDRMAVAYLRSGVIGKVKRVWMCSNRKSGMAYRLENPAPQTTTAPEHLDWDLWLGTAPERPYAPEVYHPHKWRSWLDFGTGWSGDIGCHIHSAVWKALALKAPTQIYARVDEAWTHSPERRAQLWPRANHITWTLPGTSMTDGDITLEWFDGVEPDFYLPEEIRKLYPGKEFPEEASLFEGEGGYLLLPHGSGPMLLPRERFAEATRPEVKGENHYHAFLNAILHDTPLESSFDFSGPMSEAVILGTVASRFPNTKLDWNVKDLSFTNHAEANSLLRRRYRAGWEI